MFAGFAPQFASASASSAPPPPQMTALVRSTDLIQRPQLLKQLPCLDLDVVYEAYRYWMKTNNHRVIKLLVEEELLQEYNSEQLLADGYQNNKECFEILAHLGVDFSSLSPDDQAIVTMMLKQSFLPPPSTPSVPATMKVNTPPTLMTASDLPD